MVKEEDDDLEVIETDENFEYGSQVLTSYDESLASSQLKSFLNREQAGVIVVSLITLANGLVAIFDPLAQRLLTHPKLFDMLVPYGVYHWSRSLSLVFGFILIALSWNLFARKRLSYLLAMILLCLSLGVHFIRAQIEGSAGGDALEHLMAIGVAPVLINIILLWYFRKKFSVRSEPRWKNAANAGMVIIGLATLYGTLGFFVLDKRDFGIDFRLGESFIRTTREFLLIGNPDLVPHTNHGIWFLNSLRTAGFISLALALFNLFRPIEYNLRTRPQERARVAAILNENGADALDHYKLLNDKSYSFSPDFKCCVAYTTTLDVAIALGDPVGPKDELRNFTKAFVADCHENGWSVAFMQTSDRLLEIYRGIGLSVLKVGEDAVVDLEKFSTSMKKDLKSRRKKFDKEGYTLDRMAPPHAPALIDEVESVSKEWLSLPGRRERGFSLGQFDRAELADEVLFVLKNPEGKIIAFVNQVRSYAPHEVSIDMMRHRNDVPGGTMDYLFVKLFLALKDNGFKYFNLGLAALSGVGDKPDASMEEKGVHMIYEHMNRFFSYKGLRYYKSKFDPTWQERFLVYEGGPPGLIKTALAILRATEA